MTTQPIVVWTEIAVKNLEAGVEFYDSVFGWTSKIDRSGPMPMAVLNGSMETVGADLVEGTGGGESVIHFALPDALEAGVARLELAGGAVQGPVVEIPFGRFVIARDPDGNKIGLFEPKAA